MDKLGVSRSRYVLKSENIRQGKVNSGRQKCSQNYRSDSYNFSSGKKVKFSGAASNLVQSSVTGLIEFIEKYGLVAEFTILDMLGSNIPRTYQGFQRNKEELGHLNYKAGVEDFIREALTGPSMFLIPMGLAFIDKKYYGTAAQIQFPSLMRFKDAFEEKSKVIFSPDKIDALNADNINETVLGHKKGFYDDILDKFFKKGIKDAKLDDSQLKLKDELVSKLESLAENQKKYNSISFFNFARKAERQELKTNISAIKGEIFEKLTNYNKEKGISLKSVQKLEIIFDSKDGQKVLKTGIDDFADNIVKYSNDVIDKVTRKVFKNKDSILAGTEKVGKSLKNILDDIHINRIGGRTFINFANTALIGLSIHIIPKFYKRNKQYPGLEGLVPEQGGSVQNNSAQQTNTSKAKALPKMEVKK